MNKYLNIIPALLFLFLLLPLTGIAQTEKEDVVYLKDGSIIRGDITEMHSDSIIKIEVYGGNLLVFEFEEIKRITTEEALKRERPFQYKDRGYMATLESSLLWGQSDNYYGGYDPAVGTSFNIINSFVFNNYAYAGIGTGIDVIGLTFLPVFARGGGWLYDSPITPVYYADFGYGFILDERNISAADSRGGLMGGAGIGVKFHTRSEVSFDFTAGIRLQKYYIKSVNWDGTISEFYHTSRRFTTRIAMTF